MWVAVKYEQERFLGKVLQKICGQYVRCLSMPFGVNTPKQSEEDEGVYYTEVYQSDLVLQNKQNYNYGKKIKSLLKKACKLERQTKLKA